MSSWAISHCNKSELLLFSVLTYKIWFPITSQFLIYLLAKKYVQLITWTYCPNLVDALRPHSFFDLLLLPGVHLPTDLLTDLLPKGLLLGARLDLQDPTYTRILYLKQSGLSILNYVILKKKEKMVFCYFIAWLEWLKKWDYFFNLGIMGRPPCVGSISIPPPCIPPSSL